MSELAEGYTVGEFLHATEMGVRVVIKAYASSPTKQIAGLIELVKGFSELISEINLQEFNKQK